MLIRVNEWTKLKAKDLWPTIYQYCNEFEKLDYFCEQLKIGKIFLCRMYSSAHIE